MASDMRSPVSASQTFPICNSFISFASRFILFFPGINSLKCISLGYCRKKSNTFCIAKLFDFNPAFPDDFSFEIYIMTCIDYSAP
jgi:hypothetical protein